MPGSVHDYALLKQSLPTDKPWFKNTVTWLDSGFQGIKKDYTYSRNIKIPYKKLAKSKKNPAPKLTEKQEKYNRKISKIRVYVEHAIGSIKQFHCLMHRVRNHLDSLINHQIMLCAGLHNMKIALKINT